MEGRLQNLLVTTIRAKSALSAAFNAAAPLYAYIVLCMNIMVHSPTFLHMGLAHPHETKQATLFLT